MSVSPYGEKLHPVRGFFVVWWRCWAMQKGWPWYRWHRRAYWATKNWNTFDRGKDFAS